MSSSYAADQTVVNPVINLDQRHSDTTGGDFLKLGYALKGNDQTGNPGGRAGGPYSFDISGREATGSDVEVISSTKYWAAVSDILHFNTNLDNPTGVKSVVVSEKIDGQWVDIASKTAEEIYGEGNTLPDSVRWGYRSLEDSIGRSTIFGENQLRIQSIYEDSASTTHVSNLITYQGDLNYDGRVSMKDLAYLNAGAARQVENQDGSIDSESVARDVDADFSGKIDMADLRILDADWGKTLHTGNQDFLGSEHITWEQLDSQGESSNWDNTSFKDQNAIEADDSYVGSLETPGATNVVGSDGIEDGSNPLDGDYFQSEV